MLWNICNFFFMRHYCFHMYCSIHAYLINKRRSIVLVICVPSTKLKSRKKYVSKILHKSYSSRRVINSVSQPASGRRTFCSSLVFFLIRKVDGFVSYFLIPNKICKWKWILGSFQDMHMIQIKRLCFHEIYIWYKNQCNNIK